MHDTITSFPEDFYEDDLEIEADDREDAESCPAQDRGLELPQPTPTEQLNALFSEGPLGKDDQLDFDLGEGMDTDSLTYGDIA